MIINNFLIDILPWILGIGVLYALLYLPGSWNLGHHLIIVGAGSYIGYLLLALLMYALQSNNIAVFSIWLPASATTITFLCWFAGQFFRYKNEKKISTSKPQTMTLQKTEKETEPKWLIIPIAIYLCIQLSFIAVEVAVRPAVSWDSVWYWTTYVAQFLEWQNTNPHEGTAQLQHRHPATLHLINAWSAYAGTKANAPYFLFMPWLLLYVGTTIAIIGFLLTLTKELTLGLLGAVLLGSYPMFAAQTALAGYADIWLAAGIFFSFALIALIKVTCALPLLVSWLFFVLGLAFLKSAGLTYALIVIFAASFAWIMSSFEKKWTLAATALILLTIYLLYAQGFDTMIGNYPISFHPETQSVKVGRYSGTLNLDHSYTALYNLWFSFVWHSSYALALAAILVTLLYTFVASELWRRARVAYGLLLILGLLAHSFFSQTISSQVLFNSAPGQDTGLTRFSMGLFLISPLMMLYIFTIRSRGDSS